MSGMRLRCKKFKQLYQSVACNLCSDPATFSWSLCRVQTQAILWWSQLVTSPLWAQELSFELLFEIASTYMQTDNKQAFYQNVSLGSAFPSLPCLPKCTTCLLACFYPSTIYTIVTIRVEPDQLLSRLESKT